MNNYYTNQQNTISFQQICLQHYKRILEIATKEFTGGYWNYITMGTVTNKNYETDKKKEFCQSVEILADALFPHFDKEMKEIYEEFEKEETQEDKKEDLLKKNKILFRELSRLLHRLDYLKGASYTESIEEDDDYGLEDD